MAPVKHSVRYPGRADSTCNHKSTTDKAYARRSAGEAEGTSMNEYLPWLLIIAGILAVAAAVIYWRMSYVESD